METNQHPAKDGRHIERREIVSCQGRKRELVRYSGQRRWYRTSATASQAYQWREDC